MTVVQAHAVRRSYGARVVLEAVELAIENGERVGVVGNNGAGKSTLARILAGVEQPDSGTVSRRRGSSVVYLAQTPEFEGDPTAEAAMLGALAHWSSAVKRHAELTQALASTRENIDALVEQQLEAADEVERLGGFQQQHRAQALLGHLGIERGDARVSSLSGGEQRRVALARLLIARPDLAILDESTNHLDAETIEWLEEYLLDEHTGAVLLITHDRYLLDRVAQRTLEVKDGRVYSYDGGYELFLEQKALREEHAARTEQNRQNFLRRELEWLRRQPKARTTKQKARIERAEAAEAELKPRAEAELKFSLETSRAGKTILELRELALALGGRTLVSGLDLFLTKGQIIGVVGRNGTGKTTLLRAITGELAPSAGRVIVGQNTKLSYFDQQRSGLDEGKSVFDNVAGDGPGGAWGGGASGEPRQYLERFGFSSQQQRQPVGSLSGGERARVALARCLRDATNLLLLDEPTNDLDVSTLGSLEEVLVDSGASAIVVTHDRWFLDRVASAILAFEGDGRVVLYPGNYDSFRRLRALAREQKKQSEKASTKATRERTLAPNQQKPKRLTRAEEQELSSLPDAIEAAESSVKGLNAELSNPQTHARGRDSVEAAMAKLAGAQAEVERLMQRWELLEEKRAALNKSED